MEKPAPVKKLPDMKVVMEAWKLEEYSLTVTSNARHFPKKYRFSLCAHIQNVSLEIVSDLIEANEIDLKNPLRRQERSLFQERAMRKCKILLHFIELSKRLSLISDDSFEYWARIATNVKNMSAKWHQSDAQRVKQLDAQKGSVL